MFNLRLIRFFNYDKQTRGFVPEIYKLLSKYGLTFVLSMYVRSGAFPSVVRWKTLLNQVVFESTKLTQYNRLCDRYSLDLVSRVCNDKEVSQIWKFSRSTPTSAKTYKIIMYMFSVLARDHKQLCGLCGYLCSNNVTHRLCLCNKLTDKREKLWNALITKYGYKYVIAYSKHAPFIQCGNLLKIAVPNYFI